VTAVASGSPDLRRDPPRSLLFVPGDRAPELLDKARRSGADATIVDLEDAVAPERKDAARAGLARLAGRPPATSPGASPAAALFIRINAVGSAWFGDDIRAVARDLHAGVVLPKCASPDDVLSVAAAWRAETDRPLLLLPLVETAAGVLAAAAIGAADPAVIGLALGAEDLAAEVGFGRSRAGREILYARSHVVLAAAASGLWAVDTPCLDFERVEVVRRDARLAASLGFAGKFVIHPAQVAPVHDGFRPTRAEVERAARTLAMAEDMTASGRGVAAADGRLIDRPMIEAARRVLARAARDPSNEEETHVRS
jgi:citrate lyase subunit beta/citryl-CoA lyase